MLGVSKKEKALPKPKLGLQSQKEKGNLERRKGTNPRDEAGIDNEDETSSSE